MRWIVMVVVVAVVSFVVPQFTSSGVDVGVSTAHAVNAPTKEQREKGEQNDEWREKRDCEKLRQRVRTTGCKYGSKKGGKCWVPRQGQFYRDPADCKMKMMKIKDVNLPWDPH